MIRLLTIKLDDPKAEQVRVSTQAAIAELQAAPSANESIVTGVSLPDAAAVLIPHRLGRTPSIVTVGVPVGATAAGYIVETRDGVDRSKFIKLTANSYGATITVDVACR